MMDLKDFTVSDEHFSLKDYATEADIPKSMRAELEAETAKIEAEIDSLQEGLYADSREGLIIVLQAPDAAGKDSLIRHVMGVFDPQGVTVTPFKQPSKEELAHDFLWRAMRAVPNRGQIGIFNRSYYEDVLIVRVHDLQKTYEMPPRCLDMGKKEFFDLRYKDIRNFEDYLYHNGYRVVKLFLNLSKRVQGKRFLERMDNPDKQWKVSSSDMAERAYWDDYQKAYEECIRATASKHAPWYVLPADRKWQTRYYGALALRKVLKECCTAFPTPDATEQAAIAEARTQLLAEGIPEPKE